MAMNNDEYVATTRQPMEKVVLRNNQFARWLARRKGVSSQAIKQAMILLGDGILEALAEGFSVTWMKLGTFEPRELQPRKRWHRKEKRYYMSNPSVILHFRKADGLNERLRAMSQEYVERDVQEPTINPVVKQ